MQQIRGPKQRLSGWVEVIDAHVSVKDKVKYPNNNSTSPDVACPAALNSQDYWSPVQEPAWKKLSDDTPLVFAPGAKSLRFPSGLRYESYSAARSFGECISLYPDGPGKKKRLFEDLRHDFAKGFLSFQGTETVPEGEESNSVAPYSSMPSQLSGEDDSGPVEMKSQNKSSICFTIRANDEEVSIESNIEAFGAAVTDALDSSSGIGKNGNHQSKNDADEYRGKVVPTETMSEEALCLKHGQEALELSPPTVELRSELSSVASSLPDLSSNVAPVVNTKTSASTGSEVGNASLDRQSKKYVTFDDDRKKWKMSVNVPGVNTFEKYFDTQEAASVKAQWLIRYYKLCDQEPGEHISQRNDGENDDCIKMFACD